jgi:hypothetical protein
MFWPKRQEVCSVELKNCGFFSFWGMMLHHIPKKLNRQLDCCRNIRIVLNCIMYQELLG